MNIVDLIRQRLSPLVSAAQAINPSLVQYSQNALQQSAQGKGPEFTPGRALAPLAGPIGNFLFGVPHQQAAGSEIGNDIAMANNIARGAQGLVSAASRPMGGAVPPTSVTPASPVTPTYTDSTGVQYFPKTLTELAAKNPVATGLALGGAGTLVGGGLEAGQLGVKNILEGGGPVNVAGAAKFAVDKATPGKFQTAPPMTPEEQQQKLDADLGGNPLTSGILTEPAKLTNDIGQLTQLHNSDAYVYSSIYDPMHKFQREVDANMKVAQDNLARQQSYLDYYNNTAGITNQYNNVIHAIGSNTGLLEGTDWYNNLANYDTKAFSDLNALMAALAAQGVDTKAIIGQTGDNARSTLERYKQQMLSPFKAFAKNYGQTPQVPVEIPALPSASPQVNPMRTQSVFSGGGAGAGLPKAGPHGLPPLQPNGMPMKKTVIPPKYMYR